METVLEEADPEVLTRPDALDHVEMHQDLAAICVGKGASPVQLLENDEMHQAVDTMLKKLLPPRALEAVNWHFGRFDGVEYSRHSTALRMGTTFKEVTRLLRSAFRILQSPERTDLIGQYANIGLSGPDKFSYLYSPDGA